jgi:nucleotide-binding universal stress UspA family protein
MDGPLAVRARLGRVLHATDLSPQSDTAFAHGLCLSLAARGSLCIVHTVVDRDKPGAEWEAFPGVRQRLADWGRIAADAPADAVSDELGLHVRKVDIPDYEPIHGILGLLDKHPYDLLVLTSQVRDGVDRWLHPSIAEALAREARLPTLFLPQGARGFIDPGDGGIHLRNILIPVDRAPRPAQAISLALALAAQLGAETAKIHLLHVGAAWPEVTIPDGAEETATRMTAFGPVVDQIVTVAEELDADLIVMATHGHDGVLDALRGSTTEQVLRRAKRALLAVPAG